MKYIKKDIKNEPESLRIYRNTTPNPVYKGGSFDQQALKIALLTEQGYLCAYCMGRISLDLNKVHKPKIEVEHYFSQVLSKQENSNKELLYQNMLGVCNGLSITYPEAVKVHHCDKTEGKEGKMNGDVQLRKLDPRSPHCEQLVSYTKGGEILAANDDEDVKHDLEKALNLNNKVLIEVRKNTLDAAKDKLLREKPIQQWNKAFFQKHIDEWLSPKEGRFPRYCMIVVWFLQELMNKPHYNR